MKSVEPNLVSVSSSRGLRISHVHTKCYAAASPHWLLHF